MSSTGWVYVIHGACGEVVDFVDAPPEVAIAAAEAATIPKWATVAGNIMWALNHPPSRENGWRCFNMVDRGEKSGNPYYAQVRQAIRRIARRLMGAPVVAAADPLAELDSLKMPTPEREIEAGGSIRA
jgi:hypothetical protein